VVNPPVVGSESGLQSETDVAGSLNAELGKLGQTCHFSESLSHEKEKDNTCYRDVQWIHCAYFLSGLSPAD
jgi:hypothetical protein